METKNKGFDTGIASEYLVLSMLYRLGVDAYMTLGNKKSVDIWIKNDDDFAIEIDVKSVREYDSIPVGNVEAKDNRYIVFVITTVQRNYPIGSVDLNRNHSSDVLV